MLPDKLILFPHQSGGRGAAASFTAEDPARYIACEQALLFGRAKRAARERASERRSREGPPNGELARRLLSIPIKIAIMQARGRGAVESLLAGYGD